MPTAPPPLDRFARLVRIALTLLVALVAALACEHAGAPLPWLIGPLLATAALGLAGAPVAAAAPLRDAGQWAIGTTLGLYFTPQVLAGVLSLAPAIAAGVGWALLLGQGFAWSLRRAVPGTDRATAHFAAAIGGASEMATLAERHGGRVDAVAAAHSLRLLLVVVIVPFGFQAAGLQGLEATPVAAPAGEPAGLALLVAATAAAGFAAQRLGVPNAWVLGPLAAALALTAGGVAASELPPAWSHAGQLFIGVSLGSRFTPAFVHTAPRWLAAVAAGTLAMIGLSAAFAIGLARLARLPPATVMLGTSPGGIAEMCLTAQALQLGVPVVTAFHVVRYVAVLLLTTPLYRGLGGLGRPGR